MRCDILSAFCIRSAVSARNVNAALQGRVSFTSDSFSDNITVTVFMNVSVCLAVRLCFVCRLRGSSMLMKRRAKNSLTWWFNGGEEVPASLRCISCGQGSIMDGVIISRLEHSLDLSPVLIGFFLQGGITERVSVCPSISLDVLLGRN